MERYKIIRFFSDMRKPKLIKTVSSLELAKLHCSDEKTKGSLKDGTKWFDGFKKYKARKGGIV